ncbi:MAG: glycosyltransferase family 4 protein [Burkholderiaceae bacterium]
MHIAYVTETYPPELNGVALTVARTVRGLRARGHSVQLIRPKQAGEPNRDNDDEWRAPGMPIPMYPDLRIGMPVVGRLGQRWSRLRPDVVHVATEGPLGWAAVRAARLVGIPVTSDFRTNYDEYSAHYGFGWMSGAVRAYLRNFHNGTDRTLVPTPAVRAALHGKGYERLDVLGRGVDCQQFSPARRSETLRASWGATNNAPVLLYVGRLASEKNVPLAFRAYDAVRARVPGARMVVVGDGPLRARLQKSTPGAVFVGQQSGVALAQHYASSDIFVFPSTTETFGNVTLEALASALLLVAFRSGAAAVHVEDCESGVLVEPGDDQGFVAGACALAQQFRWLSPMRQSARDAALQASWESVLSRFEIFLADSAHAVEAQLAGSCPA